MLDAAIDVDGETLSVSCASMGNPHAVLFVDDPDTATVAWLGTRIENHPAFPNRVNVEFVTPVIRSRIRQRTWERGTGETLACGSGACAVAVVSILRGVANRSLTVELRGGELEIDWESDEAPVIMTGPAAEVFRGSLSVPSESVPSESVPSELVTSELVPSDVLPAEATGDRRD